MKAFVSVLVFGFCSLVASTAYSSDEKRRPYTFADVSPIVQNENNNYQMVGVDEDIKTEIELYSLEAQFSMNKITWQINNATQDMRTYAFWSLIFTAIGSMAVFTTLFLMVQANKAATKAALVAKNIGEAQIRAYLVCKSAKYTRRQDGFFISVCIENVGSSPANKISIRGKLSVFDVVGTRQMTRVANYILSDEEESSCQPVASQNAIEEDIFFSWDHSFFHEDFQTAENIKWVRDMGNELSVDLCISWNDVFNKQQQVLAYMSAVIGPHPASNLKNKARSGKMDFRITES